MMEQTQTIDQLNLEFLENGSPQDTFNTDDLAKGGENVEFSNENE